MEAHGCAFSHADIKTLEEALVLGDLTQGPKAPRPKHLGQVVWTATVTATDVKLALENDAGVLVTHRREVGVEQFWVRQESRAGVNGEPPWTIVRGWEVRNQQFGKVLGRARGGTLTWVQIKAVFLS